MKGTNVFEAKFAIGDEINFRPMYKHQKDLGIADEDLDGTVVAVKFTEAKVFYDVYSPYWGKLFENVTSEKTWKEDIINAPKQELV